MRARGPFEVKPRQLRALVLLLVLLPLLPTTFVVRFLFESVGNEQIEARERTKPRYQQFLDNASAALAVRAARDLPGDGAFDPASWWNLVASAASPADAVLLIQRDGRLMLPPASDLPGTGSPQSLARAVLASGVHYAALPRSGPVRWRFFSETPEPLFALHPRMAAAGPHEADEVPSMLLIRRRQRLLDSIRAFYQRTLDPQTTLHLLDENGDSVPLVGPDEPEDGTRAKPLLAETALPPPLPTWRVRLYSVDAALVDGVARGQIALYWWTAGGMFLVTAGIAGAVGWTLTRRIALHELGNDSLAVVSHEMKTPLASTRLFIETLLDRRYRDPEQADEYLRLIAAENVRLERLVDSFQTAARVGSGRRQRRAWLARRETVRAEEIVAAACDQLRARLNARDGDFEQEIEPGIPPFPADRETLVAALVNLLDNAWKYTGADKRIRLRVRQSQDGGHAWLTFEVSDNGIGIEPDEQGRIFERFYQSDARLSRAHEGVGLGLSIVRSVVRAHGGTVSVQSKPGKGSTFTLRLPLPAKKR
jgi:signal transduction histidine kinase